MVLLGWNGAAVGALDVPDVGPSQVDPETHRWDMFVDPLSTDVWYTAPGTLESGREVHAFHGEPIPTDRPPEAEAMYPTARWRKYLVDVWREDDPNLVRAFANYLCQRWDAEHPPALETVQVRRHTEETNLDGETPVEHETLAVVDCP